MEAKTKPALSTSQIACRRLVSASEAQEPIRVEPAVRGAIVRQARDVPMGDKARIGAPNARPPSNEDDAPREALQGFGGIHAGAQREKLSIGACKVRNAGDRARACHHDMSPRDLEKPRDIGNEHLIPIALPRKATIETKLPRSTYGTDDLDDGFLHRLGRC